MAEIEDSDSGEEEEGGRPNAGDPGQVRANKRSRKLKKQQEDEALRAVLETYEGRAVVWTFLERAHVFAVSHQGEATHETAFKEGERNVGLQLWTDVLRVAPKVYPAMSSEAAEREKK